MIDPIPENLTAYLRFLAGNATTKFLGTERLGPSVRPERFSEEKLNVLRVAHANAKKRGAKTVDYPDYPLMANGQHPYDFYKGRREKQDFLSLYTASATDPVFQMFSLVGGFGFTDDADGGFSIKDHYGFDEKKSKPRTKPAMDIYTSAVRLGQDISKNQTYNFYVEGRVPPQGSVFDTVVKGTSDAYEYLTRTAKSMMPDEKFIQKMAKAAYDTVDLNFKTDGFLNEVNVPIEFLMMVKKSIDKKIEDFDRIDLALVDFPEMDLMPSFLENMTAEKNVAGGYDIYDPELEVDNITFRIPAMFERYGELLENIPNADDIAMLLPTGFVSDSRLDFLDDATTRVVEEIKPPESNDSLSFTQAYARERQNPGEVFIWRGAEYMNA